MCIFFGVTNRHVLVYDIFASAIRHLRTGLIFPTEHNSPKTIKNMRMQILTII